MTFYTNANPARKSMLQALFSAYGYALTDTVHCDIAVLYLDCWTDAPPVSAGICVVVSAREGLRKELPAGVRFALMPVDLPELVWRLAEERRKMA